jgi:acyl-CoA thioesterase FadM
MVTKKFFNLKLIFTGEKMVSFKRKIRMSETDQTGFLYFTNLQKFAVEAFEELTEKLDIKLFLILESLKRDLPIVSVKADYKIPLKIQDEIIIRIESISFKETSLTVKTSIFKEEKLAGEVFIVHVMVSKDTNQKVGIDNSFRDLFSENKIARI